MSLLPQKFARPVQFNDGMTVYGQRQIYTIPSLSALPTITVDAAIDGLIVEGYASAGDGGRAYWKRSPGARADKVQDASGAYFEIGEDRPHVRAFGVVGDYDTDDRLALIDAFDWSSATGKAIDFSGTVCGCVGSIDLPEGVRVWGDAPIHLNTWFYTMTEQQKMRPGYKHTLRGAGIILKGAATLTYETNRTTNFQEFSFGLSYLHLQPWEWVGVSVIRDYDVLTAGGAYTTSVDDNRSDYDCGVVYRGPLGRTEHCCFHGMGWWSFIIHSQADLETADSDYNRAHDVDFTSLALIAGDSVDTQGLTGFTGSQCGFYNSADHHDVASGEYADFQCIYIDGNTGAGLGSRGHLFNGNFRSKANTYIQLDHCDDVTFSGVAELPTIGGQAGADEPGEIRGTANTGDVNIEGGSLMRGFRLITEISGRVKVDASDDNKNPMLALGGASIAGGNFATWGVLNSGDPYLQFSNLTDNPTASSSLGWVLRNDISDTDSFDLRYNNDGYFKIASADGAITLKGNITSEEQLRLRPGADEEVRLTDDTNASALIVYTAADGRGIGSAKDFAPTTDGTLNLGDSSNPWAAMWANSHYLTSTIFKTSGTGSPEGVVTANPTSEYLQTDGVLGHLHWKKRTGTGNTGWVPDAVNGVIVGMGAVAVSHTGDTAVTTLKTVTVPAGLMGPNGRVEIWGVFTHTNGADDKTLRIRFGGASTALIVATTTGTNQMFVTVTNRNATNSQLSTSGLTTTGTGSLAIDTTAAVDIIFTVQLENGADTATLEAWKVLAYYGA